MKKTILLVEDSKVQRLANERMLHKAGYEVLNAGDGEEALRLARESSPDLILLDMLLPLIGGEEVLRQLKQGAPTAQIPVIALSSLPQSNSAKLVTAGAADYFEKGRLVEDKQGEAAFLGMIERVLRQSEGKNQASAPAPALARQR